LEIIRRIRAVAGYTVIVTHEALVHSIRHFHIPDDLFLTMLSRVLREPNAVYEELHGTSTTFHIFYKLETSGYVVAVVKIKPDGAFLVTVYPTRAKIRPKHAKLKKVEI